MKQILILKPQKLYKIQKQIPSIEIKNYIVLTRLAQSQPNKKKSELNVRYKSE